VSCGAASSGAVGYGERGNALHWPDVVNEARHWPGWLGLLGSDWIAPATSYYKRPKVEWGQVIRPTPATWQ